MVETRVAVLSTHEPRDISYYTQLRQELYEAYSLRALRFLGRATGVYLDEGHWFQSIASTFLLLSSTLIFIGFFRRRIRRLCYWAASFSLIFFASWIFLFAGVASLNQADMKGGHRVQDVLDVTTVWGLEAEVIWDWNQFSEQWNSDQNQPFVAIAWMGLPLGAEELEIESWLSEHRHLPVLHICIGANLPKMFHQPLFGDTMPSLDWSQESPRSVIDPQTSYGREVSWQTQSSHPTSARLVPWDKHWILYIPTSLPPTTMARLMEKGMSALEGVTWGQVELSDTIALRLDDPGSSINLHLEPWRFPTLSASKWKGIAQELNDMNASMTVGYCPGWVDDGNTTRGTLKINGASATRVPGKVHPSHQVTYEPADGSPPWRYDLQAKALMGHEVFDLQSHGHTHISPDLTRWAKSPRRYEDFDWYREFLVTEDRPFKQRPADIQKTILKKSFHGYQEMVGKKPFLLVPPGHAVSWNTADLAFQSGFEAMAGRHLVLKEGETGVRRTRLIPAIDIKELEKLPTGPYPAMVLLHDKDFSDSPKTLKEMLAPLSSHGRNRFTNVETMVHQLRSAPKISVDTIKNLLHLDWPVPPAGLKSERNDHFPVRFKLHLPSGINVQWDDLKKLPGYVGHEFKRGAFFLTYHLHTKPRSVSLPFTR